LRQRRRALVFTDSRQFGRLDFHLGSEPPEWWRNFPPAVTSAAFTLAHVHEFLRRHRRLSLKAALLLQNGFPGIGNWMADEILWQARLSPRLLAGRINPTQTRVLWRAVIRISTQALRSVVKDHGDPPSRWLFHQRWTRRGKCPRDGSALRFDQHGGRTTAWCPRCQGKS
jgi:formamidopyrimidine-DNA glycosylase